MKHNWLACSFACLRRAEATCGGWGLLRWSMCVALFCVRVLLKWVCESRHSWLACSLTSMEEVNQQRGSVLDRSLPIVIKPVALSVEEGQSAAAPPTPPTTRASRSIHPTAPPHTTSRPLPPPHPTW